MSDSTPPLSSHAYELDELLENELKEAPDLSEKPPTVDPVEMKARIEANIFQPQNHLRTWNDLPKTHLLNDEGKVLKYHQIDKCTARDCPTSIIHVTRRKPQYCLIYSGGNAMDINDAQYLRPLYRHMKADMIYYDYRGYGYTQRWTHTPSVEGCRQALARVMKYALSKYSPEQIVLIGRSIGSCVTLEYAHDHPGEFGKIILETPLQDILSVPIWKELADSEFEPYPNLAYLKQVEVPVLVIHGEADQLIPVSHGKALYEVHEAKMKELGKPVTRPVWIPGANHNDYIQKWEARNYIARVMEFLKA